MKKVLAILLTLAMLLCLAGCGEKEEPAETGAGVQTEGSTNAEVEVNLCVNGEPHTYTEEEVTAVSCENAGSILHICSECDYSFIEEIPALGHDAFAATCDEPGICATCGQVAENALGHSFEGDICKNCGMSEAEVQANTPPATTAPVEEPETTESTETTETTETTEVTTAE